MQKFLKNKHGSIIVFWAILLPTFLGLAGLVIDIGAAYVDRTRIQHIADSAALAGAAKIKNEAEAEALALAYIEANKADAKSISITFPEKNKIKQINVDITRFSPTYFLKIFKLSGMDVAAHAAATGFSQPNNPLNYAMVSDGPDDFDLFGGSQSAGTKYQGGVYSGAGNFQLNGQGEKKDYPAGAIDMIYASNDNNIAGLDGSTVLVDGEKKPIDVLYDANPINLKTDPYVTAFIAESIANGSSLSDIYNISDDDIRDKLTNVYAPDVTTNNPDNPNEKFTHAAITGEQIDFSKLNGPLFVKGNFKGSPTNMGESTLSSTQKIVIVATGDIEITGGDLVKAGHELVLISLHGDITFDSAAGKSPTERAKIQLIAPIGAIHFDAGNAYIDGCVLGHHVITGMNGTLDLMNSNSAGGTSGSKSILKLVE